MCEDQSDALSLTSLVWTEIVQCRRQTLSLSGRKGPAVSACEKEGFILASSGTEIRGGGLRPCLFRFKSDTEVIWQLSLKKKNRNKYVSEISPSRLPEMWCPGMFPEVQCQSWFLLYKT